MHDRPPDIFIFKKTRRLSQALADHICAQANVAEGRQAHFSIALSGGSLLDHMAAARDHYLGRSDVNWAAWHVFWADERWVPPHSADSNFGAAHERFLRHLPVPTEQIHAVPHAHSPSAAATAYAKTLQNVLRPREGQYPKFDVILLGIGEDGHTASLFPGHPTMATPQAWVATVTDAPKPPPNRITLTLPVLNSARNVTWVATGGGKREIVTRVLHPNRSDTTLPAGRVRPAKGRICWFLDRDAAAGISPQLPLNDDRS